MDKIKILKIIGVSILVLSLPVTLILVKQTQDNRSSAAAPDQLEAEGGVLGGNAQAKTDTLASGGQYVAFANSTPNPTAQGFGSQVTGGAGYPTVYVTNLNDSGAGSLREALSAGNRIIKFSVSGIITFTNQINPPGSNITLDGMSAPGSGITLKGWPLVWDRGNSNVIVRGLRFRDQDRPGTGDSMTLRDGSHHFLIDHCSFSDATDGSLDMVYGVHDVTIQWSILGTQNPAAEEHVSEIGINSNRVSVHHNLFWEGVQRHPQAGDSQNPDALPHPLTADVRNNLIWAPTQGLYGFTGAGNTTTNLIRNYFYLTASGTGFNRAVETYAGATVYSKGNYERRSNQTDGSATSTALPTPTEFSVESPYVITMEATAKLAAEAVLAGAGSRVGGLDSIDQTKINAIKAAGL